MASACLSDVHNYTTSVCSFPQWQAAQDFSGYASRKHCSGGASFNIHYNTLFIMHTDQCYPFTLCTSCNALPLLWFLLGLRDAHVVLYQEYFAIISLSPTGQFSDLPTACSLHRCPVYVDSCMHYEVVVGMWCASYSNFSMRDHLCVSWWESCKKKERKGFVLVSYLLRWSPHEEQSENTHAYLVIELLQLCFHVRRKLLSRKARSGVAVCECRRLLVLIVKAHQQRQHCLKLPSISLE